MSQSTPTHQKCDSSSSNNDGDPCLDLDEIDLESLRSVFGSASPQDLIKRKPHELRDLWLQKTADSSSASSATTAPSKRKARLPRFLLDPKNEDHIAPHVVALQLLLGNSKLRQRRHPNSHNGDGLYRKVEASDENDQTEIDPTRSGRRPRTNNNVLHGEAMVWPLVVIAILMLACQFVLEVFGGAGAIWGCAELATLRKGGSSDPSWRFFSYLALAVGICCLLRFLLVHPFFQESTDPTFARKYKLQELFRRRRNGSKGGIFFELARLVANDPVLFLHPTKGPALSSCFGCYCVCCGSNWSSFGEAGDGDNDNDNDNDNDEYDGSPRSSPQSLGKPSPQRSTWELSDDDDDFEKYASASP